MLVAVAVFITCFLWAARKAGKGIAAPGLALLIAVLAVDVLVTLELEGSSPDLTYGSDARFYYEAALNVVEGKNSPFDFPAPIYVAWEAFILGSSPSASFIYVLLANALLFVAAYFCHIVALLGRIKNVSFLRITTKDVLTYSLIFWANGIVLWAIARGLKEVLILFVVTTFLALLYTSRALWLPYLPFAAYTLYFLRPMGFVFVLVAVGVRYVLRSVSVWWILLFLLLTATFAESVLPNIGFLAYFREEFGEEEVQKFIGGQGLLNFPVIGFLVAMLRFVLGPGPFRSLQQLLYGDVFEVSTRVGDLLILLGSLVWWGVLLFVLIRILSSARERQLLSWAVSLTREWFFLGITLVIAYSFIYAGTGDTRHRALLYLFWGPALTLYFGAKRQHAIPLPHHPR